MNINATLLGQMITFALFVWFTMKFVWPLLEDMLAQRNQKISEGLQAAERGHKELELAQKKAVMELRETREKIAHMLEQAHKQAALIVEESKTEALKEREKIIASGYAEVDQKRQEASDGLRKETINHAMKVAEKLLGRAVNDTDQEKFLENFRVQGD